MTIWPAGCGLWSEQQIEGGEPLRALYMIAVIFPLCFSLLFHSGGTDSNGGHTDASTGDYHYHHGYPAHEHKDGVCPYDFDDQTGLNSGGASKKSRANKESNDIGYLWYLVIIAACFYGPIALHTFISVRASPDSFYNRHSKLFCLLIYIVAFGSAMILSCTL